MPILNFGSLNIDDVYRVAHIVRPGETIASSSFKNFPGGKGLNQSMALARAGARVRHIGALGEDGHWLKDLLAGAGVDVSGIRTSAHPTGRAIIQVEDGGQNSIVLFPGANRELEPEHLRKALDEARPDDWVLVQNETSQLPLILREAHDRGLRVCLNPAPMGPEVLGYPLEAVDLFIVNETEAEALAGTRGEDAVEALLKRYPRASILQTLGRRGARMRGPEGSCEVEGIRVEAVDTTAAGDTFIGYFLAAREEGLSSKACLELANRAAAIAVTRPGAASSIPLRSEL